MLGFKVRVSPPNAADRGGLIADLTAVVAEHGLSVRTSADEVTITRDGAQATDADRRLVVDWAIRRAARVVVSDLIDVREQ